MIPYKERILKFKYNKLKNSPETKEIIEYGEKAYKDKIKELKTEIRELNKRIEQFKVEKKINDLMKQQQYDSISKFYIDISQGIRNKFKLGNSFSPVVHRNNILGTRVHRLRFKDGRQFDKNKKKNR